MTNVFTDEAFLYQYFYYYLRTMYKKNNLNEPCYWFMDGFEEPLDQLYLCDAIKSLAERLGYKLNDKNMWEEINE